MVNQKNGVGRGVLNREGEGLLLQLSSTLMASIVGVFDLKSIGLPVLEILSTPFTNFWGLLSTYYKSGGPPPSLLYHQLYNSKIVVLIRLTPVDKSRKISLGYITP